MKRVASVIGMPKENLELYSHYHREVWPEVLEVLRKHHVTNYSIYCFGEILFSYFEYTGDDYEKDMDGIAQTPITQKWWEVQEPLQRPFDDRQPSEWWMEIPELFHLD
jgi:L-rhamnose mutarotase